MLTHPTVEKLTNLKLLGMAQALTEQLEAPRLTEALSFEERIGILVDREVTERDTRRLKQRLAAARLREPACLEDLDLRADRGIDRALLARLRAGDWLLKGNNVFVTGATGSGKTYLSCAFGTQACRQGQDTLYVRVPRLLQELGAARGDGRYKRMLASLARKRLLILDDWGLAPIGDQERRDLLEIVEDRHGRASTVIAGQLPVDRWHDYIGDPTLADAILDRMIHRAHTIRLKGESMRKLRWSGEQTDPLG